MEDEKSHFYFVEEVTGLGLQYSSLLVACNTCKWRLHLRNVMYVNFLDIVIIERTMEETTVFMSFLRQCIVKERRGLGLSLEIF